MRSKKIQINFGLKSPNSEIGSTIGLFKFMALMKIHKGLKMNLLRIKVILMGLKPNKIVKLKLFFGVNIGLSPYDKKIYLTI
jgi:hypothetical protein